MSTCFAEVLEVLRPYPKGLTATEVANILPIGRQNASNRLSRMVAYGHAERVPVLKGRPKYRVREGAHV